MNVLTIPPCFKLDDMEQAACDGECKMYIVPQDVKVMKCNTQTIWSTSDCVNVNIYERANSSWYEVHGMYNNEPIVAAVFKQQMMQDQLQTCKKVMKVSV